MTVLALMSLMFSVFFYAFIDATLFGAIIPEHEAPTYWIPVSLIMFLSTFVITLTPLFWKKNFLQTLHEDYDAIILLLLTPAIILSSGFLDLVSASVIEHIRGNGALGWLNYPNWWWMDPYPISSLSVPWSIAWLVSFISGHEHTLTVDMLIGSTIGWSLFVFMWTWYTKLRKSSAQS